MSSADSIQSRFHRTGGFFLDMQKTCSYTLFADKAALPDKYADLSHKPQDGGLGERAHCVSFRVLLFGLYLSFFLMPLTPSNIGGGKVNGWKKY
jgi:hypothetical protein